MRWVVLSLVIFVPALSLSTGAQAETPTPTPVTAPADASALTIHNLHNGVPYIGGQLSQHTVGISYVDGHECNAPALQVITQLGLLIESRWPWYGGYPCGAIGVPVQVCIDLSGHCAEFVYEGTDVSVDFDWGELLAGPKVTAHFVHDGSPQPVTITQVDVSSLDGGGCAGSLGSPVTLTEVRFNKFSSSPCSDAIARFETLEFGELVAPFNSTGEGDIDFYVETGELPSPTPAPATPTPTEATTPSPTAAQLPVAGAAPRAGHTPWAEGVGAVALAAGAWIAVAALRKPRRGRR